MDHAYRRHTVSSSHQNLHEQLFALDSEFFLNIECRTIRNNENIVLSVMMQLICPTHELTEHRICIDWS